jgi:hypothetical protein
MALKLNSDAQSVFFTQVFGSNDLTTNRVKELIAAGVKFEVGLYALQAVIPGKGDSAVTLTYGTTALMKGTADPLILSQNKHQIREWVGKLYQAHDWVKHPVPEAPVPALAPSITTLVIQGIVDGGWKPNLIALIKAIRTVTGEALKEAKDRAEAVLAGSDVIVATFPTLGSASEAGKLLTAVGVDVKLLPGAVGPKSVNPPVVTLKPVNQVIKLKDAKALGQKVHGTSTGSVYHTIALTDQVKVAARIYSTGSISIRTEWEGEPKADLAKLADAGVQMKADYGSIHFDAQQVPLAKVIGAFLMDTKIAWKAAVINGGELVITEMA